MTRDGSLLCYGPLAELSSVAREGTGARGRGKRDASERDRSLRLLVGRSAPPSLPPLSLDIRCSCHRGQLQRL